MRVAQPKRGPAGAATIGDPHPCGPKTSAGRRLGVTWAMTDLVVLLVVVLVVLLVVVLVVLVVILVVD